VTRKISRLILTILMICSFGFTVFHLYTLWHNPAATLLIERANDVIAARIEKQLSANLSIEFIEARITDLLEEQPHNWRAIKAVEKVASDKGFEINPNLKDTIDATNNREHGSMIAPGKCLACTLDPAACELSPVLWCRAPVDLTPVGDIVGVVRESKHYVLGEDVDMFELGLSAIGLGATVLAPITGGTSTSIKVSASVAKTANRMRRISPSLLKLIKRTFRNAIDWRILADSSFGNYSTDIGRAINREEIRPIMTIIGKLGNIRASVGIRDTLYLMKSIDTPEDTRAIARFADVMKERSVGVFEILGKNRVIRSTMRYSDEVIGCIAGIIGMFTALLGLVGSFLGSIIIKALRFLVRPK